MEGALATPCPTWYSTRVAPEKARPDPFPLPEKSKPSQLGALMKQCGTVTAEDLVTQVYERLQQLIVHGRLAPGSRIIESDLAARIGVSRTPVRSAMHRLQQEGLVVASDSGKNARLSVAPLTRADGRELLHILGCLEGMAAGWACALDPDSRRSLARDMEELDEKMRRLLEEAHPDPEHIFQLHSTFHRLPLERIDAPRLHALHSAVRPQVERYRRIYISSVPTSGFIAELQEHVPIIEALQRGDGDAASRAVQANWSSAAVRLGGIIEAVGDRGNW